MAAGTNPIYSATPTIGLATWLPATTANTKSDGTGTIGTDILKAYTAGANGAFIQRIRLSPAASVAATATTATVARIFISSITSGATTNANTLRWDEVACPAQTADQTTSSTNFIEIPLGIAIPASYTVLVSMHAAAAANTSWQFIVIAGDY
jgi:hypothetical protein